VGTVFVPTRILIGVGIGIGIGIELAQPVFAKLLADRVAALSELRQHAQRNRLQCAQALILRVAVSFSIPIPIATPTPISLRPPIDRVMQVISEPF